MTYCSKKYPFSTAFKLRFKEILPKEETGRAISYTDSRLSGLCADRRLVNKVFQIIPREYDFYFR
jgi:hypothetical protein